MAPLLSTIGAVIGAVGTVASVQASNRARRASARQQQLARRRSVRQSIRQAQIMRARAIAGAEGAGSIGGSGAAGGIGSIGSRLGGALGYSGQQSNLSGVVSRANQRASVWSGVAQLGSSLYEAGGGSQGIRDYWGWGSGGTNINLERDF